MLDYMLVRLRDGGRGLCYLEWSNAGVRFGGPAEAKRLFEEIFVR
jgi:hypothetical protein